MKLHNAILSLPDSLVNEIYLYLPNHTLFHLSKTNFNLYIDDYYKHCKQSKRGVFYYNKVNNTYIRYLIRNNLYLFMDYILYTHSNSPFNKNKNFYYNNKRFKTYIDYCIFLANLYESETTKQLLMNYKKINKI